MVYLILFGCPAWLYGLGHAAVAAPDSSYKRHGHDKLGRVLDPDPHEGTVRRRRARPQGEDLVKLLLITVCYNMAFA